MRAMRAESLTGYGGLKRVDLPKPVVTDGRVLVRLTAAGVTPLDHTILSGGYPRATAPLVLGNEGAGVVDDPGDSAFSVGTRVMLTGPYGVIENGTFGAVTEEHFDRLFNINVRGTLFTVQKALPLLNDGGSLILNGSVASVKGTAAFGVYAASKAALRSFVRTWTTDLKDRRIRSNVVSPGPINTPLASRQSADVIARMVSTIPMGRMGEPEEVAKVALFLASDDSSFVTGIELFVDGGRAQV